MGWNLWLGTMTGGRRRDRADDHRLTNATGPLTRAPTARAQALHGPDVVRGPERRWRKGAKGTSPSPDYPVALTKDAKPIYAGSWKLRSNPNAASLKASCGLAVYEGRVCLVPRGAGS